MRLKFSNFQIIPKAIVDEGDGHCKDVISFRVKKWMMDKELYPKIYLYRRIVQAKLFIDNHFAETIDLNNISDEAYFSKFHFLRLFKKIYGKTPHQYLTFVRIEKAKCLIETGLPITEVPYCVGYDSVSSFTGLFKRIVARRLRPINNSNQR